MDVRNRDSSSLLLSLYFLQPRGLTFNLKVQDSRSLTRSLPVWILLVRNTLTSVPIPYNSTMLGICTCAACVGPHVYVSLCVVIYLLGKSGVEDPYYCDPPMWLDSRMWKDRILSPTFLRGIMNINTDVVLEERLFGERWDIKAACNILFEWQMPLRLLMSHIIKASR